MRTLFPCLPRNQLHFANMRRNELEELLHSVCGRQVDYAEIPLELVDVMTLIYPLRQA